METNDENLRKLIGSKDPAENFTVPDGYFDTFSSRVKEKIEARQVVKQKTFWYQWLLKPAVGVSLASIALIVGGYFVFFFSKSQPRTVSQLPTSTIDSVNANSAEEYLTQEISWQELEELADEDILAVSFEDEEQEAKQNPKPSIESLTEKDKKEIEEYLLENADEILYENL